MKKILSVLFLVLSILTCNSQNCVCTLDYGTHSVKRICSVHCSVTPASVIATVSKDKVDYELCFQISKVDTLDNVVTWHLEGGNYLSTDVSTGRSKLFFRAPKEDAVKKVTLVFI